MLLAELRWRRGLRGGGGVLGIFLALVGRDREMQSKRGGARSTKMIGSGEGDDQLEIAVKVTYSIIHCLYATTCYLGKTCTMHHALVDFGILVVL